MDKCFICGKCIERDSIERIEPVINKIMFPESTDTHLVCDTCGNMLTIIYNIVKEAR